MAALALVVTMAGQLFRDIGAGLRLESGGECHLSLVTTSAATHPAHHRQLQHADVPPTTSN